MLILTIAIVVFGLYMIGVVLQSGTVTLVQPVPAQDWFATTLKSFAAPLPVYPADLDRPVPTCGNPSCDGSCNCCEEYTEHDPEKLAYLQDRRDEQIFTATSLCHGAGDADMCAHDCDRNACMYHPHPELDMGEVMEQRAIDAAERRDCPEPPKAYDEYLAYLADQSCVTDPRR